MKARRIFRATTKSAAERERELVLRNKLQKEKPSLEDLVISGASDPDAVMTMGMYFDVQKALQALKREREQNGLSIADVAKQSGLDRAVVSRLENGKQDNPTVATLMRYAAAVGKRFLWSYEDAAMTVAENGGIAERRCARRGASFAEIDQRSVCIFVEKLANGTNRALGTGCFFMRRDLVLTAKHVLEDVISDQRKVFITNGSVQGRLLGARPQLFYAHPHVDLALVKVSADGLQIERPLYPAHFPLNQEHGAIAIGYNREESANCDNSWTVTANKVAGFSVQERTRGAIAHVEYVLNFPAAWITPGCSGGPVITLGGGVVAVLTEQFADHFATRGGSGMQNGRATSIYPIMDCFRSPFEG